MKRLERLTAILTFLQSRRYTPLSVLVEKFEMSERTIFRDLRSLEESGVPISFEKDRGYFILDRHFLPPLAFTLEEAKSFIFVERLAQKYTDAATYQHFASALEKVKNKLQGHQLQEIEQLQEQVQVYINPTYTPRNLKLAEQACTEKQVLRIEYQDFNGRLTRREVEPIGMTFYSQNWHLIAYCRLREDYRDFVLSRISQLELLSEFYTTRRYSLKEYIQSLEDH